MKLNNAQKKHSQDIRLGMRLTGKWHHKSYVIKRKLGAGAIGTVYLCEHNGQYAALKISDNPTSMTIEVNVLKSLQKVQGNRLGPYLLDVDDWKAPSGAKYSFYVMEYLKGEEMAKFIRNNGSEWTGVFLLQLLDDLEKLHTSGWVFGDLKTENLLVLSAPPRIRWIDVGGTTQIGRAIKEFTEFNDRGYWGLGSRKAEPSYDLFALVMVFLHVYYPRRFVRTQNNEQLIISKIDAVKALKPYRSSLIKAIKGRYPTSNAMKDDIKKALQQHQIQHRRRRQAPKTTKQQAKQNIKQSQQHPGWLEPFGILAVALSYYLVSVLL